MPPSSEMESLGFCRCPSDIRAQCVLGLSVLCFIPALDWIMMIEGKSRGLSGVFTRELIFHCSLSPLGEL